MHRWRIYRERVVERIRRSKTNRVLLLLADAGYGKSVALKQFLDGEQEPCAFYRVAPDTTTLLGFLRGLTTALEPFVPGAHLSFTMAYERSMQSTKRRSASSRRGSENICATPTIRIAIDDLHHAASDDVGDFLSHAIDASPRAIKWIIATRSSKAFSPSTWLAQREMDWPIDESELRFTSGEVAQLAQSVGMTFSPRGFDAALRTSDGWPSAAALALMQAETLPALEISASKGGSLRRTRTARFRIAKRIGATLLARNLGLSEFSNATCCVHPIGTFKDSKTRPAGMGRTSRS